jgi:DNA repair exonuclease SbcCD ATPase subunit
MRIVKLKLSGFRGFAIPQAFDLDADAVVVIGANGQGKTSLFDGILWGLTGNIPRLGDDAGLVSMYSSAGEARVEIELHDSSLGSLSVMRSFDGGRQQLRVEHEGEVARDQSARVKLLEILWPEAVQTPDSPSALTTALTRSVYLQQDLVREFIEAESDQDRFGAVSELVGAGRVTELALALERAKAAWSRATNVRANELQTAQSRLSSLETHLTALAGPEESDHDALASAWGSWWERAIQFEAHTEAVPELESSEAPRVLDAAMKRLDALRRSGERRASLAEELLSDLQQHSEEGEPPNVAALQEAVRNAEAEEARARGALQEAESRAAERRRLQVQLRETRAELRALAELALRHLEDRCPVCGQVYDKSHTQHRLEELVGTSDVGGREHEEDVSDVSACATALEERERLRAAAQATLRESETREREHARWRSECDRRLRDLGIEPTEDTDPAPLLDGLAKETRAVSSALDAHQASGERLALELTRASERARRKELEAEVEAARVALSQIDALVRSRQRTGETASRILDGLRDASSQVVAAQLERIEPLLQRVYATADPHPSFRAVRLLTRVVRGRGRLNAAVDDPLAELSTESPEAVLSSSQMNALAVSVFLALNLGVPTLPLQAAMLDDPLQSLDDVNLLGLIDLLRRTKDQRQLLISTHDARFGRLLARKLRPVRDDQRTRVIELDGWNRTGPSVRQDDAARDPDLLRIAA